MITFPGYFQAQHILLSSKFRKGNITASSSLVWVLLFLNTRDRLLKHFSECRRFKCGTLGSQDSPGKRFLRKFGVGFEDDLGRLDRDDDDLFYVHRSSSSHDRIFDCLAVILEIIPFRGEVPFQSPIR